ncbi:MAG: DNA (cytosine-5-)-methyltransferase [Alphaproteobacteria bacterium]
MSKLTVGSMFSGIGGICSAFKQAGFDISWANEIDDKACKTYKLNFPNTNLIEQDVHKIQPDDNLEVDIITSGFPCQAFSVAGYRKGFDDDRGNLFFETARFIDKLKPKSYLLENVKNLKGHDKGNTLKVIQKTLEEDLGYSFIPFILNSKDYGNIPQTRERIYIVGFRNEAKGGEKTSNFKIPEPIKRELNIQDMIDENSVEDKHYYKQNSKIYPLLLESVKSRNSIYQYRRVYVRENKSNVCPTLTANMGTGGHNVPIIKTDKGIRKLTPRECFNFQGFPKNFNIPLDLAQSHLYKQVGNSVVIPVVKRIATEIKRVINN